MYHFPGSPTHPFTGTTLIWRRSPFLVVTTVVCFGIMAISAGVMVPYENALAWQAWLTVPLPIWITIWLGHCLLRGCYSIGVDSNGIRFNSILGGREVPWPGIVEIRSESPVSFDTQGLRRAPDASLALAALHAVCDIF